MLSLASHFGDSPGYSVDLLNVINIARTKAECSSLIIRYYNLSYTVRRQISLYPKSFDDIYPADVYFGREQEIIEKRNKLKEQTLVLRRQQYLQIAGV